MELLSILSANGEWHDYSKYIIQNGYGWSRNDLDSSKSTRTKDGKMRRDKLTDKRKLSYGVRGMTRAELAQLDDDLSQTTFQAKVLDLHGPRQMEFYCSSFSADLNTAVRDVADSWTAGSFNITEV